LKISIRNIKINLEISKLGINLASNQRIKTLSKVDTTKFRKIDTYIQQIQSLMLEFEVKIHTWANRIRIWVDLESEWIWIGMNIIEIWVEQNRSLIWIGTKLNRNVEEISVRMIMRHAWARWRWIDFYEGEGKDEVISMNVNFEEWRWMRRGRWMSSCSRFVFNYKIL
jgi:hypothetical protein